ncbi:MAG: hypothetical protein GWN14_25275, partial [candidate division Zixibacteria bacterium]|nr:hypothetical protein [candidate division Zixibacteria bacterium]NIX59139.1 hypothetical protein [candidate division Zixibacteria bacterium]
GLHYQFGTTLDVSNNFSFGAEYKEFRTEEIEFEDEVLGVTDRDKLYISGRIISGFIQYRF